MSRSNRSPSTLQQTKWMSASKHWPASTWPASVTSVPTTRWVPVSSGCSDGRPASACRPAACSPFRTTTRRRSPPRSCGPTPAWNCARGKNRPPGIVLGPVGGGRYAVYRLTGPYDGIAGAYRWLFEEWLPGSGEKRADGPCMELYRHAQTDRPPEKLVTDLCVPLRTQITVV